MGLLIVLATVFMTGVTAQSGCTNVIIGMAPCLNYITGNSSNPSSSCCSQLANVVQTQPRCLCSVLNGGGAAAALGLTINQTLALALPGACNVQTPPISRCNAADGPATSPPTSTVDSPADSPVDSSSETPDSPITPIASDIPAGSGSKTVPRTGGDTSNGNTANLDLHLVMFLLFIASCTSTLTSF
ncbi:Plant lipid transfer protein/Par allergen [Macleaya cordata]|uniref:Plant lipid transfer protein/Par allergen n=1 Tax=Macleaya cordata TaxID=56857 RepID=A0A200Q4M8_MACCD|nr:Plant lipid transfer protein/Par allergen [Macleaya cordata]